MYENFYGLSGAPFRLAPDPAFFFASQGHGRALSYLEYGVQRREGFIVLTGEVGAGKTTLLRYLIQRLDPAEVVVANLVCTQLDSEDALRMVCGAFGLRADLPGKALLLRELEAFFTRTRAAGRHALLVVDEAQNLPASTLEELRMLSNLQAADGHPLLQCFLLGQPEFRATLAGPQLLQLRQRVTATYHLGALRPEETRAYIEHRLRAVGWQDKPSFKPAAFARIHRYTEGVPRRINAFCDRLMLMGFLEELQCLDRTAVEAVRAELEQEMLLPDDNSAPPPPEPALDAAIRDTLNEQNERLRRVEASVVYMLRHARQQFVERWNPKPSEDERHD